MVNDEWDIADPVVMCPSCQGAGVFDIGDSEDGIWETCPDCNGTGEDSNESVY